MKIKARCAGKSWRVYAGGSVSFTTKDNRVFELPVSSEEFDAVVVGRDYVTSIAIKDAVPGRTSSKVKK